MARSTPTIDGDRLYAFSSDGDLACLQITSGKLVWQKNVRREFGGVPGTWAYAESPLIDGDAVIIAPGGAEATLLKLNKRTGAVIWKSAVPGGDRAAYSSAIAIEAAGRKQYVQFLDKGLVGVDAPYRHISVALHANQRGTGEHRDGHSARAIRIQHQCPSIRGRSGTTHSYKQRCLCRAGLFRARSSELAWRASADRRSLLRNQPEGPAAAEFATGKIRWKTQDAGPGAVFYADGHLYFHLENGDVALVEATPDAYREKGRFTPSGQPKRRDSRERAWSYPVVANGRLYIRDLGHLWAYDVKQ